MDRWEIAHGLPSNKIRAVTQTPDGYLWIATSKGLVRYDGIKFSIPPLYYVDKDNQSKPIIPDTLFLDRIGVLWIGSPGLLKSYNCKTNQAQTFVLEGNESDGIRRINEDIKGNLWISFHSSKVKRFFNGEFINYDNAQGLSCTKVNAIIEDQKGNIILGARDSGLFIYKDDIFSNYPAKELEDIQVITMQEDWQGNLWVGTVNGLYKITGQDIKKYTIAEGLIDNHVSDILEDSERNLWIGTLKGLNRIRKNENDTDRIDQLPYHLVVSEIFEDQEKNLWIGTDDDGLIRFKNRKFLSYKSLTAYPKENPSAVYEDRSKNTWIGTISGKLFRCRGPNIIETINSPEMANIGIVAINEDMQGNFWFGTIDKGIFQKNKDKYTQYTRETTQNGLCDNTVMSIYRDSSNNLWLSTFGGLSVIRNTGNKCVIKSFPYQESLFAKKINYVYEDKAGNLWIAAGRELTILPKTFVQELEKQFSQKEPQYKPDENLKDVYVTCIQEDISVPHESGIFWIATAGYGLKYAKLKDGKITTIVSYTKSEGLISDNIYQFLEDMDGYFWLMSDSGILRVKKSELVNFTGKGQEKINCISLDKSDGLKELDFSNKFSTNSVLKSGNGEFWFLTDKGISITNPEKIRINKTVPGVNIEAISINQVNVSLDQKPGSYIFKGNSDFCIQFTAPTFLSPEKIKFKYRLENFDKDWLILAPGKERTIIYKNLGPGTYIFTLTACNADGVWGQSMSEFAFTVKPFFHQTIFFKIILLFILAMPSYGGYYLYKKHFNKKNPDEKKKYQGSMLDSETAEDCAAKLKHLMEVKKVYRNENISLQSLAHMIPTTPHVLSQLLNEKLNRNFSDYINSYRVEEAVKILSAPGGKDKKNWIVAHDVGFNNMGVFYKAFKKYTGKTPTQYKKKMGQKTSF
jgi:ligand-binding sensor domain-containing protein/AraC-like DNA-binding protein